MSLALARKYRPATFDDLIGQEAVSQTLSMALENDRLSHAYLFSGLRGSGKTSTARIFAKALLCEKGTTAHPCGVCNHCVMASESRHMDIIEMDAASNRKIDDIRELIEHTKYKPSTARYKIFIIDEVHMLTKEAYNALLKTLEEPPDFVKFILATTDPLKLPATILSRTQHFRFRNIPQSVVSKHLAHILNLEGVQYEENALEIIARSGAGSVRDSLTLLDQAIVYSKNFIDISTVTSMLGIIEPSMLDRLLEDILRKDQQAILAFVSASAEFEAEMVIDELILYLKEKLLHGSTLITPMYIERFFRILVESKTLLSLGTDGEFVLSLSLFKMMEALQIKEIDMMIKTLEKELSSVQVEPLVAEKSFVNQSSLSDEKNSLEQVSTLKEEQPQSEVEADLSEPIEETVDEGKKLFEALVVKMYDRNYELGQCFEQTITYSSFEDNLLTWESIASTEQKTLLKNNWMTIRTFAQELFGYETKIQNIAKELPSEIKAEDSQEVQRQTLMSNQQPIAQCEAFSQELMQEPVSMIEDKVLNQPNLSQQHQEEEMKSSCISPGHDGIEAAKEKDERTILDEPMIAKALELFNPKMVRVNRK
jgi:DNA polymerase-3 subunit gamma/tau